MSGKTFGWNTFKYPTTQLIGEIRNQKHATKYYFKGEIHAQLPHLDH